MFTIVPFWATLYKFGDQQNLKMEYDTATKLSTVDTTPGLSPEYGNIVD